MNAIVMVLISRLIWSCLCFEYEYDMQHINRDLRQFNIPERFDARRKWGNCTYSIDRIYDSRNCKSEWAFIAASVMTDRLCIVTNGAFREHVSVQELVECVVSRTGKHIGCEDGFRYHQIFAFWKQNGVVTERCKPLSDATLSGYPPPECHYTCTGKPKFNYRQEKTFGAVNLRYFGFDPKQIQAEIMLNGPVMTIVSRTNKLLNPRPGVAIKYKEDPPFYKAKWCYFKLIGWDVIRGVPAWIAASAHSKRYADKGFVFIKIGERGFRTEDNVFAGLPDTICPDRRKLSPSHLDPRINKPTSGSTINAFAIILFISVFIMVLI